MFASFKMSLTNFLCVTLLSAFAFDANAVAPIISQVSASSVSDTSVIISWVTNKPADSRVNYGLTTSYSNTKIVRTLTVTHSIKLSYLKPGTLYNYRVRSRDSYGSTATSANYTFRTLSSNPSPTPTPAPTAAPTPVPTPAPTASPTPIASPTPTPTPTPTPPTAGGESIVNFTASSSAIMNPERGFSAWSDLLTTSDFTGVRRAGLTMTSAVVHLDAYRAQNLDSTILGQIDQALNKVRAAQIKIVLRFMYNDGPWPVADPDASKAQILAHLQQLKPYFAKHGDVIATVQAGFIGAWGEWHSSTNGLDTTANRSEIINAIVAALPANRMTQIRVPTFKADIFGTSVPLSVSEAFSGSVKARIGHHNDCFLASADDFGTYPSNSVDAWKSYIAQDGRFTPVGGETCAVNVPRTDCSSAMAEMRRLHFSYLNHDYHPDVINGWKSQGCYNQIVNEMGYRFSLVQATHTSSLKPGQTFSLKVSIKNTGYAAMYNKRPVKVVIQNQSQRQVFDISNVADPRRWESGLTSEFTALVSIPATMAAGAYTVSLQLPDEAPTLENNPNYSVQFANANVWDAVKGENKIGTLNILQP